MYNASDALLDTTARTPCVGVPCLLETNIRILPALGEDAITSAEDMLSAEDRRMKALGEPRKQHYISYAPSRAVDGRRDTAFCSMESTFFLLIRSRSVWLDLISSLVRQTRDAVTLSRWTCFPNSHLNGGDLSSYG